MIKKESRYSQRVAVTALVKIVESAERVERLIVNIQLFQRNLSLAVLFFHPTSDWRVVRKSKTLEEASTK